MKQLVKAVFQPVIADYRKKIEITSYELNHDLLKAVVKQLKELKWV